MPEWMYTARTAGGDLRRSEVELPTREAVIAHLRDNRLVPVSIREKPTEYTLDFFQRGIKTRDLVVVTRQFATMINSGLPLVHALEILVEQADNEKLAGTLADVLYQVESGHTLAEALEENEDVFSPLYINMVAAGEAGGILDTILLRLATFLEKSEALTRKVRGALIYPAVIMLVAIGAIGVLLMVVVPTFEQMFASFDQALPLPTRIVLGASGFLQSNFLLLLGGLGAVGAGLYRWIQTPDGRLAFDRFVLQVPIVGDLVKKSAIARFTRTLGTLLSSGVSILEGLEITAKTAGNEVVKRAVMESREAIAGGEPVAEPLGETEVFPPMVTQMIHVGEQTGSLDEMLETIADFYEDEVDSAVESLVKAIEPVMMVVIGGIVALVMVAIYMPIFNLITSITA